MRTAHSDVFTRDMVYGGEVKEIEERLGRSLASYSLTEILEAFYKRKKLSETVNVSNNLIPIKILQTIIDGARFNGQKWRNIVNMVNLTEEQERQPITTESDFVVYDGPPDPDMPSSGGDVVDMQFDVTDDDTTQSMTVQFRKKILERRKFNLFADATKKAGAKFSKKILDDVVEFGINNAQSTEALAANDRFIAVSNLVATMEEAGFPATAAAMTPTDFAQVLQTQVGAGGPMPFITNTMLDKSGNEVRNLKFGEDYMLLGYIPGIKAVNTTLGGDILIVNKESAINFGMYKDIRITNWEDPFKAFRGFNIETTYQIKTDAKLDKGIGKVTGV